MMRLRRPFSLLVGITSLLAIVGVFGAPPSVSLYIVGLLPAVLLLMLLLLKRLYFALAP